ncbi:MAG: hypothetical protein QHG99_04555 [Methanomicrobiales archaeon]|nr:hypothetical protein [Methanomicrobiales archaeon]
MERQDLVYFVVALFVIAIAGLIIKPAISGGTLPFFQKDTQDSEIANYPEITPIQPPVITTETAPAKNPVSANDASSYVEEISGPRKNRVSIDYPVLQESRPHPPEDGIRSPSQPSIASVTNSKNSTPVYKKSFNMRFTSIGLMIEAVESPVVIDMLVTPKSENPNDAFLIATVRDPFTMTTIEENGYGRQYSSRRDKQIVLYRYGRYHLTLYGNLVDANIAIYIGDASVIKLY